MMTTVLRRLVTVGLTATLMVLSIACSSGGGENSGSDVATGSDAGVDTAGVLDTAAPDATADDTGCGTACEDTTAPDDTVVPEDTADTGVATLCETAGQPCDPVRADHGIFVCIANPDAPATGACRAKCDQHAFPDPCTQGSRCFDVFEGAFPFGACIPSDCSSIFLSAEECDEGTCTPGTNATHFCAPAGEATAGATCSDADDAATTERCGVGLLCLGGTCRPPCHTDPDDCGTPKVCVPLVSGHDDVGICLEPCTPFAAGECAGGGESCRPVSPGTGFCVPAGSIAEGEPCGDELGRCAEGLLCSDETSVQSVCRKACDPDAEAGALGACEETQNCASVTTPFPGVCVDNCDPWAEPDPCPEGQGCIPYAPWRGICIDAGAGAVGETCEHPYDFGGCDPGLMCSPVEGSDEGVCAAFCLPFDDSRGNCPEDLFCSVGQVWLGVCREGNLGLALGDSCGQPYVWCDEYILCLPEDESSNVCRKLCRVDEPANPDCAPDETCDATLGADIGLGTCTPP